MNATKMIEPALELVTQCGVFFGAEVICVELELRPVPFKQGGQ